MNWSWKITPSRSSAVGRGIEAGIPVRQDRTALADGLERCIAWGPEGLEVIDEREGLVSGGLPVRFSIPSRQMSSARSLATELRKSRRAFFFSHGEIESVNEEELKRFIASKVVKVKITKMDVTLESGTQVGSMEF